MGPVLLQELGALRYQPTLWSLQYEVMETAPEFNISNLFWDTEYCVSVEPRVASRCTGTTRTDEQCVTTGQRDSKCWGPREGGGLSCGTMEPPQPPGPCATCTKDSAMFSLAGSAELVLSAISSSFITLLLLGLLAALLVCTYIRRPMRPPSVLVRQPGTRHLLPLVQGCRLG